MAKPNKHVKKTRTLEERETDLKGRLEKITLLKQIRENREKLKSLKQKK